MRAIRVHENGGPEVLRWEEFELPPPGPGEQQRGMLKVEIGRSYALRDAAQAHRDLEARRIAGSAVLMP
jgi:NADPH:quinone reductase-like Zn-dependent oxidoreductase